MTDGDGAGDDRGRGHDRLGPDRAAALARRRTPARRRCSWRARRRCAARSARLRCAAPAHWVHRVRQLSKQRHWALDLRLSLLVLFALAWLAQKGGTSILIAGFGAGVMVALIGGPKRLSTQMRGVADGFFVPLLLRRARRAARPRRPRSSDPAMLGLAGALVGLNVAIHLLAAAAARRSRGGGLAATRPARGARGGRRAGALRARALAGRSRRRSWPRRWSAWRVHASAWSCSAGATASGAAARSRRAERRPLSRRRRRASPGAAAARRPPRRRRARRASRASSSARARLSSCSRCSLEQLGDLVVGALDEPAHLLVDEPLGVLGGLADAREQRPWPSSDSTAIGPDRVAHAPAPDHLAGDLGELLDVGLGAGGDRAVHDLLGHAARRAPRGSSPAAPRACRTRGRSRASRA